MQYIIYEGFRHSHVSKIGQRPVPAPSTATTRAPIDAAAAGCRFHHNIRLLGCHAVQLLKPAAGDASGERH